MSEKFQNKYRNGTFRAQWWNYGWNGAYFITICTKDREHFFGEIENNEMILSKTGVIATILWNEIPKHHDFVELGDFVVMPNHVHGILIINKPFEMNNRDGVDEMVNSVDIVDDQQKQSKNQNKSSILPGSTRFQNIGKNTISSIVGSYKSAVTKYANRSGFPNGWQRLFHEHIIRNDVEYQRISNYIINNPKKWNEDKFCNPTTSK